MKTETIFLTGITGTLGGWLAREALEAGHRLIVLVRDMGKSQATDRVAEALGVAGAGQWQDQVEILYGDLRQPYFGLKQAENIFKRCDRIIHSAAATSFQPSQAKENKLTNVEGTRKILDMARACSLPLVYISTAYVAGCRQGLVKEDELDLGQTFNNSYEESKYLAEVLVRRWSEQTSLETIILRPSIVLGDSLQGRIGRFNTIYDLMRIFELVKTSNDGKPLRVIGLAEATKNIISVDYFAHLAWRLIVRRQPGTYHLTNPNPPTNEMMRNYFSQLFDIDGIRLVDLDTLRGQQLTKAERFCRNICGVYDPYMLGEQAFDRTHTDAALHEENIAFPKMDLAYFQRLLDYAHATDWGRCNQCQITPARQIPPALSAYFSDFLAKRLNHTLVPDLRSLNASFKITMKESSDWHWSFTVERGVLTSLSRNGQPTQCDFLVDLSTFSDMVAARITPQQAFFKQQIQIEGDTEIGLKIATVLADFFRQCPCEVVLDENGSTSRLDQTG